MNENRIPGGGFVGFEYKDITVSRSMGSVYADGYANFGWTLDEMDDSCDTQDAKSVRMKFKRDRTVVNKAELTRLQRQFEASAEEITSLERGKATTATIAACSVGVAGAAFIGGSLISYLNGVLPLCIVLAVPGLLGWAISPLLYSKIKHDKTAKLTPLIEQKYDEIYATCEKANGLLHGQTVACAV